MPAMNRSSSNFVTTEPNASISVCDPAAATFIVPHPVSYAYRLGLVGVAIGLFLLPVIYLGIVAAVIYGVYYHLTRDLNALGEHGLWGLVAYLGPALIGGAVIWFMLRPLFAKRASPIHQQELSAVAEPVLFEFIYRICDLVRAPRPRRVYVMMQPNACASLEGLVGLVRGELNLTIGLPLVARLTIGQLGGVLAHEFGHFAQGTAMRLTFIVRTLNNWIARIAFQPEVVERKVANQMRRGGLYGYAVSLGLQIAIRVTRQLLHRLLLLGHAISCYSTRQMEYDADLYEVKVAGFDAFVQVSSCLRWLNGGFAHAMELLQRALGQGHASADLVELIRARSDAAEDYDVWTMDYKRAQREHWYDTHPSNERRIANVAAYQGEPAIRDQRSASILFANFSVLCRIATKEFYERMGVQSDGIELQDLDGFCRGEVLTEQQIHDVRRFFANRTSPERPFSIAEATIHEREQCDQRQLIAAWEEQKNLSEPAFLGFAEARAERIAMLQAKILSDARVRFSQRRFGLPNRSPRMITKRLADCESRLETGNRNIEHFDIATRERLANALKPLINSTQWEAIESSIRMLNDLQTAWPLYLPICNSLIGLVELLNARGNRTARGKLAATITSQISALRSQLEQLSSATRFVDRLTNLVVAERVLARIPRGRVPLEHELIIHAREALIVLGSTYFQHLAQICSPAAAVEG